MNSTSAPQSPGKHVVTSRQVSLLWKDFLMNLKLRLRLTTTLAQQIATEVKINTENPEEESSLTSLQ